MLEESDLKNFAIAVAPGMLYEASGSTKMV